VGTQEKDGLFNDVGSRLRKLRQERSLSMRALARESGLSTNALSMIERGRTSPSVSTLTKISGALGIPITAFFREEPPKREVVFCKAEDRSQVSLPHGLWEGMGGELFAGFVEPFLLTLESGASSGPYGMIHTGHEFVMCLEGLLEYTIEEDVFLLSPGDSLIFSANLRHNWQNPFEKETKAVFVLAGFEQGERPSEFHITSGLKGETIPEESSGDGAG
jgi:transcriptional regulator with XRE-family HTH domain